MLDPEFVKWLATLGVGGILAAMMFHFYRTDRQDCAQRHAEHMKRHEATAERLESVVRDNTGAMVHIQEGVSELTGVVVDLRRAIETRQRKFDHDSPGGHR